MNTPARSAAPVSVIIAGAGMALFFIIGRWSPSRIFGDTIVLGWENHSVMLLSPRQWIAPVLLLALLLRLFAGPLTVGERPIARYPWYERLNFVFMALLFTYMLASVFWAPDITLALLKAHELFILFSTLIAIRLWLMTGLADEVRRWCWTTVMAFVGLLAVFSLPAIGNVGRLSTLGGGPNIFGRFMALLTIGSLEWKKFRVSGLVFIVPAIAVSLLILTGSRGAMLAGSLGLLTYLALDRRSLVAKFLLISVCTLFLIVAFLWTGLGGTMLASFSDRVINMTFEEHFESSHRSELFADAISLWRESPIFGLGLSGYASRGIMRYPHNLFLELLCEGGIVAAVLFVLSLLPIVGMMVFHRRELHTLSVSAFVMYFVASMFSGDLYNSLGLFLLMLFIVIPAQTAHGKQ